MQSIVQSALSKYFDLFIKNYSPEQFQMNLFSGTGTLNDLELVEDVVQEILFIPTNLVITKATCNLLQLTIPSYVSFRSQPLSMMLDTVVVHLEEPDKVPPPPTKVANMWDVDASAVQREPTEAERLRAKQNMDILYNLTYEVKNLTLLITTKSNRNTVIRCRLQNTRIESCNSAWQVVSLAESRDIDEVRQTETRYKITRIKSISISVSDPRTNIDTVLAANASARYRQTSVMHLYTGDAVSYKNEFIFERLDVVWDKQRWTLLADCFSSLGAAFAKEVPVDEDEVDTPVYDVAYEVTISEWSCVFDTSLAQRRTKTRRRRKDTHPQGDATKQSVVAGVKLHGVRWKLVWLPQKRKLMPADMENDAEREVYESVIQLILPAFSCSAIGRSADSSTRYAHLITQAETGDDTKAAAAASFEDVKTSVNKLLYMKSLENYYDNLKSQRRVMRRPKAINPNVLNKVAATLNESQSRLTPPGSAVGSSKSARAADDASDPPLLAISFIQRWPVDASAEHAAKRTRSEVRVVMSSMLCVFDRPALDRLASFFATTATKPKPKAAPAPAPEEPEMSAADARAAFRNRRKNGVPATVVTPPDGEAPQVSWMSISRRMGVSPAVELGVTGNSGRGGRGAGAAGAGGSGGVGGGAADDDADADGWADWASRTRLQLDVYDTHFVVPDQPTAGHLANTSIDFAIKHMTASTRPAWNAVPKLDTSVTLLRTSTVVGDMQRDVGAFSADRVCFQWKVEGVRCALQQHGAGDSVVMTPVLEPATLVLYGRFCRRNAKRRARLEALIECSNLTVSVTSRQYEYFLYASQLYASWSQGVASRVQQPRRRTRSSNLSPRTRLAVPEPLSRSAPTVPSPPRHEQSDGQASSEEEEDDHDDDDEASSASASEDEDTHAPPSSPRRPSSPSPDDEQDDEPAPLARRMSSATGLFNRSARYALGMGPAAVAAARSAENDRRRAAGEPALEPLRRASSDSTSVGNAGVGGGAAGDGDGSSIAAIRLLFAITIENSAFNVPLSWDAHDDGAPAKPSKVAFTTFQLVLDANGTEREVVARLAGAEALGLDHPSLPAYISFLPRLRAAIGPLDDASSRLLEARYSRDAHANANVDVVLRNASLIFVAKSSDSLTLESIASALQAYGTSLAEYFMEHNREVKQSLKSTRNAGPRVARMPAAPGQLRRKGTLATLARADSLTHNVDLGDLEVVIFDNDAVALRRDAESLERFLPAVTAQPRSRLTLALDSSGNVAPADQADLAELQRTTAASKLAVAEADAARERAVHSARLLEKELEKAAAQADADSTILREALTKIAELEAAIDEQRHEARVAARRYQENMRRNFEAASTTRRGMASANDLDTLRRTDPGFAAQSARLGDAPASGGRFVNTRHKLSSAAAALPNLRPTFTRRRADISVASAPDPDAERRQLSSSAPTTPRLAKGDADALLAAAETTKDKTAATSAVDTKPPSAQEPSKPQPTTPTTAAPHAPTTPTPASSSSSSVPNTPTHETADESGSRLARFTRRVGTGWARVRAHSGTAGEDDADEHDDADAPRSRLGALRQRAKWPFRGGATHALDEHPAETAPTIVHTPAPVAAAVPVAAAAAVAEEATPAAASAPAIVVDPAAPAPPK